ncbi:MAG: serine hydrolase [Verrucomicrobiales bacterium]|nr:serine hydrolase [Verrucomicrobiales bacterium]
MNRRRSLYLLSASSPALLPGSMGAQGGDPFERIAKQFMADYKVPGLSVAFASGGKLKRREAFGFLNVGVGAPLRPEHQFRIASVSKSITAAAIFKLIEAGRIGLTEPVFGSGGILPYEGPDGITVYQLLTHTSGGWPGGENDPMFQKLDYGHAKLIQWALKEYPPVDPPGKSYAYSNFGYCLLGRIIEVKTNQLYDTYVKGAVLKPCGINLMHLGANYPGRDESQYYNEKGKVVTYPMEIRRMDAHGGWVGSPTELVEFGLRVDGFPEPPDILQEDTVKAMTYRGGLNPGYACGWNVNEHGHYWHMGSLPGLTSILVRTSGGDVWAACANTRREGMSLALDELMWKLREIL